MRRTKIICTIGPVVNTKEKLMKLIKCGMNCARFNFSHGTHESQKEMMDILKEARKALNREIPILLDTKGPELRFRDFENGSVILKTNDYFTIDDNETELGNINRGCVSYHELGEHIRIGQLILVDDGKIQLKVKNINGHEICCKVLVGGKLSNHKSLNVPNSDIPMAYLSDVDKSDLLFGISQEVDFVAASFVRTKQDMIDMRKFLDDNGGENIQIIAKIENTQGVRNYKDILEIADGIMVARGDLGVETPFEEIPSIQKKLIEECNKRGKISVVATQMLESMTSSPRPTRAEVSDVANAVFDGAGAIMLSGESANGLYPFDAVKTMSNIATSAEKSVNNIRHVDAIYHEKSLTTATCKAAVEAANSMQAKCILVLSRSGNTAKILSSYKPSIPVIAMVAEEHGCRQCSLYYDLLPIKVGRQNTPDEVLNEAKEKINELHLVKKGDVVVLISGTTFSHGHTDSMLLYEIE